MTLMLKPFVSTPLKDHPPAGMSQSYQWMQIKNELRRELNYCGQIPQGNKAAARLLRKLRKERALDTGYEARIEDAEAAGEESPFMQAWLDRDNDLDALDRLDDARDALRELTEDDSAYPELKAQHQARRREYNKKIRGETAQ